jgi:tumor protein p53-inducible protein 3
MKAIRCLKPGGLEALEIQNVPIPVPKHNEVLIKVHATALNRADILQRKGFYNPPAGTTDILGLECSGEIVSGTAEWSPGTRVMGFVRGGGYAEYVAVHKDQVLQIPSNISYSQAAGISETWLTAFKCLVYLGNAKKGEKVLIHAGASGVGTALISLAKWKGLQVTSTCGTEEKEKICKELGSDFVWNYKNGSFVDIVKKTGGVDLIMDCVGRSYFKENIECINREGRWVIYGFLSGAKVSEFDMASAFSKLVTMKFTSFRSRSDEFRADVIKEFIKQGVLDQFSSGRFYPVIFKEINFEDVKLGHEIMERNENYGKIIMKIIK